MCVCVRIYMFTTYIYIFTIYVYVYIYIYIALLRNMNLHVDHMIFVTFLKGSSMSLRVLPLLSSFFFSILLLITQQ